MHAAGRVKLGMPSQVPQQQGALFIPARYMSQQHHQAPSIQFRRPSVTTAAPGVYAPPPQFSGRICEHDHVVSPVLMPPRSQPLSCDTAKLSPSLQAQHTVTPGPTHSDEKQAPCDSCPFCQVVFDPVRQVITEPAAKQLPPLQQQQPPPGGHGCSTTGGAKATNAPPQTRRRRDRKTARRRLR
jgi:hypothetical protein